MKAKSAKATPKRKSAPAKSASKPKIGLLGKLKDALGSKKPAPAKPAARSPAAKAPTKKAAPAPAKPSARPAVNAHNTHAVAAKAPSHKPAQITKPAPSVGKSMVTAKPQVSKIVMSKSEEQIRRMSDKDYMNETQLDFFRQRLLQMRAEVLAREVDVKERLHQREIFADPADRATAEEEHWLDLRLRERESLLLRKIDEALRRIENREYGYCEKTGDAIGIPRLLARPTATVCVDIKGQDERVEAQFRDR